jgi:hypothetical protein
MSCHVSCLSCLMWCPGQNKRIAFSFSSMDVKRRGLIAFTPVITCICMYVCITYHSSFIFEGVAEIAQIYLRDPHILSKCLVINSLIYVASSGAQAYGDIRRTGHNPPRFQYGLVGTYNCKWSPI